MAPYPKTIREQVDGLFQHALKVAKDAQEDSGLNSEGFQRIHLAERIDAMEASIKLLALYVDRLEAKEADRSGGDELPRLGGEHLPMPEDH